MELIDPAGPIGLMIKVNASKPFNNKMEYLDSLPDLRQQAGNQGPPAEKVRCSKSAAVEAILLLLFQLFTSRSRAYANSLVAY
jgi:hypothetical protein